MLSVITFKWKPIQGYRSQFGPETVNVLRRMVARHYPHPHRFICITDDAKGIDPEIQTIPLWSDYADLGSPHGWDQPSCYRRLKLFKPDIAELVGKRFVCMDLDTVVTGDLTPIFDRPEPFVIWGETDKRSWYNGSLWLLTAGARPQVWEQFDPRLSPHQAKRAGRFGSDQGWISYCLGKGEATWSTKDGVYSYRVHLRPNGSKLPENARLVMFHGREDPWHPQIQKIPWVRECWN